jgi:pimeloyl-ACP methyl ester carboxylesterase
MTFSYDTRLRPAQPATPAADAFAIRRAPVADGVELGFVREGAGGIPLLLVHGCPESKRIWWRNIAPLAAAGFDVIVPDFRGIGDSDFSPGDQYDITTDSRDLYALVHDQLGLETCIVATSDYGGVVCTDLIHRFPGFVSAWCVFNTVTPMGVDYSHLGLGLGAADPSHSDPTADYRELQGARPDELAAMLPTPEARRLWVAGMYQSRLWASKGTFSRADVDFMTEPFAEEARLRASWAPYQLMHGRPMSDIPLMDAVDIPTLVLYGPDDHVLGHDFLVRSELAFPNRIGPLVVPGAGHFLQWERADVFNATMTAVFGPR